MLRDQEQRCEQRYGMCSVIKNKEMWYVMTNKDVQCSTLMSIHLSCIHQQVLNLHMFQVQNLQKQLQQCKKGAKREIGGRKEDHHQDLGQMFSGDQFEASGKSLEKQCQGIGDHHHPQQLKAKPGTTFDCSCPIAWIHVPQGNQK